MAQPALKVEAPRAEAPRQREASLWGDVLRRLLKRKTAVLSAIFILLLILVAALAPVIAPYAYEFQDLANPRSNPSAIHWLGTDQLGRDIFSRMVYGTRVSLSVALVVTAIKLAIGITLGLLAGYVGGWVDNLIMRVTDIMYAFPDLLLAILIMGIRGPGLFNIFLALSLVTWPGIARIVRGQVLAVRGLDFVQAAQAVGAPDFRIVMRHVLPNIMSPVIVTATLGIAGVILSEASLSFLGIGVQPPMPSWGMMVSEMRPFIYSQPVLLLWPCVTLALTVLAFNFLGDGLRDALDPRLKQ